MAGRTGCRQGGGRRHCHFDRFFWFARARTWSPFKARVFLGHTGSKLRDVTNAFYGSEKGPSDWPHTTTIPQAVPSRLQVRD